MTRTLADPAVDADVAVVGAGPVGSTLAILLAQLGRSVIVLERWPEPYLLPRAVHLDHEVGRILQSCGIGDALRAITEPAEVYEWRNAAGTTLLRFGRVGAGLSGWPQSSMFNQPALEQLLARRADELPGIEVRRGVEVTAVEQHGRAGSPGSSIRVVAADGSDVTASFVVGCDGANSTVRPQLDLPVHDLGFFYDWLIVDVVLDRPRAFDPLNLQICDPARPTTVVSGGPGRRRWEFMRLPHEDLDALHDESRAWALLEPWDVHPGNARLERHAVYTFQARYAERWRSGRGLLAGDAAHQMPPFAGQGMCAGIRDAANLAWKLDLVVTGRAPLALLDTYEQERVPSVRSAIELSMELGRVICVPDPVDAAARDEAMAALVTGELTRVPDLPGIDAGLVRPGSPHAGQLFLQGATGDGRGDRLFDDVHGAGWRLVTIDGGDPTIDPGVAEWFATIGGRIVVLDGPEAAYHRWFAEHDASWALQRPDFHLYGTATDPAGATDLLIQLRTHLRRVLDPAAVPTGATP